MTMIVKQRTGDWTQKITATYGSNSRDRRGTLRDEIRKIGQQNNFSWVIGGTLMS